MDFSFNEEQFRYLLDLVYLGNWVINSIRGDDRIKEYDAVEEQIFAKCLKNPKFHKLVDYSDGELIPSRRFAEGGIHEVIETYEDTAFYEILAEELALKDLEEPVSPENFQTLASRIETYLKEFDAHGTEHVSVDLADE